MALKSKLLAPVFVIAAIVVAYSPLRAVAQETSGITKISDAVQVPEGLTTEISARAGGGGARMGGGGGGGSKSFSRSSGGSKSVGRSSGGSKKVSSGKSTKHTSSKTGTGKTGSGKTAGSGKKTKTGSKTGTGKTGSKTGTGKTGSKTGQGKAGSKTGQGKTGTGKIGTGPGKKGTGSKIGTGPGKKGNGKVGKGGPGKVNKGPYVNVNVNRGRNRIWRGTGWATFVGFGTLAAILVGADYYDPYGYVAIARPYCEGFTDDGCQLRWQSVALEEGGADWQCVQFCPRVRVGVTPVPAAAAPAVDLSAQAAGSCEVVIYAEPNMTGTSTPTLENQPRLVDVGWKDEISSIEVKSGTWDFYTGDDYAGDTIRLTPGTYGQLAPDWTKHIGSFQCSNPS